jgi:hypothetical protein
LKRRGFIKLILYPHNEKLMRVARLSFLNKSLHSDSFPLLQRGIKARPPAKRSEADGGNFVINYFIGAAIWQGSFLAFQHKYYCCLRFEGKNFL